MSKRMTYDEFLKKYKEVHNDINYDFDESTFVDSHTPMRVICKKHGEFWKSPRNILKYDCWQCSYEKRRNKNLLKKQRKYTGINTSIQSPFIRVQRYR